MGLYDRDYTQADYNSQFRYAPQMRMGFPRITPVVKWLLIINFTVFFIQMIFSRTTEHHISPIEKWFAIYPISIVYVLQAWRLITYQFLHSTDMVLHIFFNMLALFFLGPTLERHWSSKRFLLFYLSCGAIGGLLYPLLLWLGIISPHPVLGILPMVGASGAILGMLAACAILFPQFVVFIFIFPVPIRVAAIIIALLAVMGIITGENAGGEAAHLAGLAAGAIYVFSERWRTKLGLKIQTERWQKKLEEQRKLQLELDRILQKVHAFGIHSLTSKEKRILKKATQAEQMKNRL